MNLRRGSFSGKSVGGRPLRESESKPLISERVQPVERWGDAAGRLSWLVAQGLFLVNFAVIGQGRAMAGILYVNAMKDFHVDRKMASSPYSFQQATRMLFGSVTSLAEGKFGTSRMVVLGCILAAVGSASCYVAEDIRWITIMWGGVYGMGTAFTSTVNVALIEQHFTKYRSSASGLASSGACFGAVLFPALMEAAIQKYGIQGSFLIMGGIVLNAIPVAMLLSGRRTPGRKLDSGGKADRKRRSFSDNEEIFEARFTRASGSKNLTTNSAYQSFFDSGVSHQSRKESRMRQSCSLPHGDLKTFRSAFCDPQAIYSREKSAEAFPDSLKLKEEHHTRKNFQIKSNDEFVSVKCVENSGQEKDIFTDIYLDKNNVSQGSSKDFRISRYVDNSDDKERSPQDPTTPGCENGSCSCKSSSDRRFNFDCASSSEKQDEGEIAEQFKGNFNSRKTPKHDKKAAPGKFQPQNCYGNVINFDVLRENSDFVLNLLANKIPIGEEETVPLSGEITRNDLETPDKTFISEELQRIEHTLQQPYDVVQRFLNDTREKLKKFKRLIDKDRSKFLMQKKLDLDGRKLKYKDIRNVTIRNSGYAIEIFEYCCEMPIQMYIPIKLQELYERSSAYMSYYSGDKRFSKVLRQLKKLHELFSGSPVTFGSSSATQALESKTLSEVIGCSEDMKLVERRRNAGSNPIITALKLHANPMFLLIGLSRGLTALTFVPVVTSSVDFAVDKGVAQSDGTYAIAALSVGDFVGRLCTGWITDKVCVSDVKHMTTALILQGIFTAVLPQTRGATMVLPTLLAFGIFQGSLFVKHPVVLMKYLREHEKRIGLGFMNLLYGILGFLTPHYIGYFRDYLGSYDMMHYLNGGLSVFVGFLWVFEPYWIRFVPVMADRQKDFMSL